MDATERIEESEEEEVDQEDEAPDLASSSSDSEGEGEGQSDESPSSSSGEESDEYEYEEESDEEEDDQDGKSPKKSRKRKLEEEGEEEEEEEGGMDEAMRRIGEKKSRPLMQKFEGGRSCALCSKEFKYPNLLKIHLQTHVNKCPECGLNLLSYHALRSHLSKEHREPIKCTKCDYKHRMASQVRRHFEQMHVRGMECPIGGCRAVVAFNRLRTHIAKMHAAGAAAGSSWTAAAAASKAAARGRIRPRVEGRSAPLPSSALRCEECGHEAGDEEELEMHVQSAHGAGVYCPACRREAAAGAAGEDAAAAAASTLQQPLKRMRLDELQQHIEEAHGEEARLPTFHTTSGREVVIGSETTASEFDGVSRSSQPTSAASDTIGPTSCSVPSCPSVASRRKQIHPVRYSTDAVEEEEEEESETDKPSTSEGRRKERGRRERTKEDELDEEIREMEESSRKEKRAGKGVPAFSELGLACKECGKIYANTDSLRKHKARVHEKRYTESTRREKKYACYEDGCGKAFKTPGALEDHLNVHRGIAAHECEHCDKTFTTRAYYARHLSRYHQVSIKSADNLQKFMEESKKRKRKDKV